MSTEAIALANLIAALARQPTEEERRVQAGIDATMRQVIRHDLKNPVTGHGSAAKVTVVGATPVRGSGWAEPRPIVNGTLNLTRVDRYRHVEPDPSASLPLCPLAGTIGSQTLSSLMSLVLAGRAIMPARRLSLSR